jgi:hypothetical protein
MTEWLTFVGAATLGALAYGAFCGKSPERRREALVCLLGGLLGGSGMYLLYRLVG